jgi:hypothetical protein
MGHERIGFLPKSKFWNHILEPISQFEGDKDLINNIANQTINNIRKTYQSMPNDESVISEANAV